MKTVSRLLWFFWGLLPVISCWVSIVTSGFLIFVCTNFTLGGINVPEIPEKYISAVLFISAFGVVSGLLRLLTLDAFPPDVAAFLYCSKKIAAQASGKEHFYDLLSHIMLFAFLLSGVLFGILRFSGQHESWLYSSGRINAIAPSLYLLVSYLSLILQSKIRQNISKIKM